MLVLSLFVSFIAQAQKKNFSVQKISLPFEISYYDNQFSGLFISHKKLYLMSESRLQDKAEAKLYTLQITDIERKLIDTSFVLPYKKIPIYNLDILRRKMDALGDEYEGLEAMVIKGNDIYFMVETTTESNNCYLLKGTLTDTSVALSENNIMLQPKPITPMGTHIYNAGFEALALNKKYLFSFFEFNFFPKNNDVNMVQLKSFNKVNLASFPLQKLPFRMTDITNVGKNTFTAINYFYKGEGKDEVYRTAPNDLVNNALIKDSAGYHSYCRLIMVKHKKGGFVWELLWEFPTPLMSYNWEGIAAFKNGYFIINDKYTDKKPYSSILIYISSGK